GLDVTCPVAVFPAPSYRDAKHHSLSDGDLFLSDLGGHNLHPLIEESLRQAVQCFRHELYLPCLAMLTRAIEGAWIEMGASLAAFGCRTNDNAATSLLKYLDDPLASLKGEIAKVADYYRKAVCDPVEKKSEIKRSMVDTIVIWSEQVRDSRNVLHFAKAPLVPITYERVAVLMMATAANFQAMYAVKNAADALP